MIRLYVAAVHALSRASGVVASLLFALAMLVICEMISLRYVFRAPTIWQTDFVVYSATAAVFLGAPYVLLTRGHVGVDFVVNAAKGHLQRRLTTAGAVLGLLFCVAMTVASALYVREAVDQGWRTSGVWQIPQWIPALPLPVGFGMLCLQYVADLLQPVLDTAHAGIPASVEPRAVLGPTSPSMFKDA